MFGYIYKTTNTVNDVVYIGQRHGEFLPSYLGSGRAFVKAVKFMGRDKFKSELIASANNQAELDSLEIELIARHRADGSKLYNLADGGLNGVRIYSNLGKKFTPEHRARISAALKGRKFSKSHRDKLSEVRKGKSGRKRPSHAIEAHRAWIKKAWADGRYDKVKQSQSPDHSAKISAALKSHFLKLKIIAEQVGRISWDVTVSSELN